jgi:crotonobetaine/carnitine-CoA ligase
MDLAQLLDASSENPDHMIKPEDILYLMYTSGTTGFPKGVVNRAGPGGIEQMIGLAGLLVKPEDILYTALPLFHANALVLTSGFSMAAGVPFGLDKKFSASRFWDRTRFYKATQFNGLGAMIPILMKQPEKPDDGDNPVRLVISAACPANLWEAFEKRFNLTIWEAYGAVDGGGTMIFNFGNAPVGSVGKVMGETEWKLIDDEGNEVSQGEIGELITRSPGRQGGGVEYYKNPEASKKKVRDGWVHSGDYFYADKDGNLYFTDRKSDSMRRRGENISSFEVESIAEKHPDVAVCAAFGVPSELGEDEVMIWVIPRQGAELDLKDLIRHCADNMAYFMVPRYIDIVEEIPRTETLRIIKTQMKKQGVTERTWDREKEMPDLKLK